MSSLSKKEKLKQLQKETRGKLLSEKKSALKIVRKKTVSKKDGKESKQEESKEDNFETLLELLLKKETRERSVKVIGGKFKKHAKTGEYTNVIYDLSRVTFPIIKQKVEKMLDKEKRAIKNFSRSSKKDSDYVLLGKHNEENRERIRAILSENFKETDRDVTEKDIDEYIDMLINEPILSFIIKYLETDQTIAQTQLLLQKYPDISLTFKKNFLNLSPSQRIVFILGMFGPEDITEEFELYSEQGSIDIITAINIKNKEKNLELSLSDYYINNLASRTHDNLKNIVAGETLKSDKLAGIFIPFLLTLLKQYKEPIEYKKYVKIIFKDYPDVQNALLSLEYKYIVYLAMLTVLKYSDEFEYENLDTDIKAVIEQNNLHDFIIFFVENNPYKSLFTDRDYPSAELSIEEKERTRDQIYDYNLYLWKYNVTFEFILKKYYNISLYFDKVLLDEEKMEKEIRKANDIDRKELWDAVTYAANYKIMASSDRKDKTIFRNMIRKKYHEALEELSEEDKTENEAREEALEAMSDHDFNYQFSKQYYKKNPSPYAMRNIINNMPALLQSKFNLEIEFINNEQNKRNKINNELAELKYRFITRLYTSNDPEETLAYFKEIRSDDDFIEYMNTTIKNKQRGYSIIKAIENARNIKLKYLIDPMVRQSKRDRRQKASKMIKPISISTFEDINLNVQLLKPWLEYPANKLTFLIADPAGKKREESTIRQYMNINFNPVQKTIVINDNTVNLYFYKPTKEYLKLSSTNKFEYSGFVKTISGLSFIEAFYSPSYKGEIVRLLDHVDFEKEKNWYTYSDELLKESDSKQEIDMMKLLIFSREKLDSDIYNIVSKVEINKLSSLLKKELIKEYKPAKNTETGIYNNETEITKLSYNKAKTIVQYVYDNLNDKTVMSFILKLSILESLLENSRLFADFIINASEKYYSDALRMMENIVLAYPELLSMSSEIRKEVIEQFNTNVLEKLSSTLSESFNDYMPRQKVKKDINLYPLTGQILTPDLIDIYRNACPTFSTNVVFYNNNGTIICIPKIELYEMSINHQYNYQGVELDRKIVDSFKNYALYNKDEIYIRTTLLAKLENEYLSLLDSPEYKDTILELFIGINTNKSKFEKYIENSEIVEGIMNSLFLRSKSINDKDIQNMKKDIIDKIEKKVISLTFKYFKQYIKQTISDEMLKWIYDTLKYIDDNETGNKRLKAFKYIQNEMVNIYSEQDSVWKLLLATEKGRDVLSDTVQLFVTDYYSTEKEKIDLTKPVECEKCRNPNIISVKDGKEQYFCSVDCIQKADFKDLTEKQALNLEIRTHILKLIPNYFTTDERYEMVTVNINDSKTIAKLFRVNNEQLSRIRSILNNRILPVNLSIYDIHNKKIDPDTMLDLIRINKDFIYSPTLLLKPDIFSSFIYLVNIFGSKFKHKFNPIEDENIEKFRIELTNNIADLALIYHELQNTDEYREYLTSTVTKFNPHNYKMVIKREKIAIISPSKNDLMARYVEGEIKGSNKIKNIIVNRNDNIYINKNMYNDYTKKLFFNTLKTFNIPTVYSPDVKKLREKFEALYKVLLLSKTSLSLAEKSNLGIDLYAGDLAKEWLKVCPSGFNSIEEFEINRLSYQKPDISRQSILSQAAASTEFILSGSIIKWLNNTIDKNPKLSMEKVFTQFISYFNCGELQTQFDNDYIFQTTGKILNDIINDKMAEVAAELFNESNTKMVDVVDSVTGKIKIMPIDYKTRSKYPYLYEIYKMKGINDKRLERIMEAENKDWRDYLERLGRLDELDRLDKLSDEIKESSFEFEEEESPFEIEEGLSFDDIDEEKGEREEIEEREKLQRSDEIQSTDNIKEDDESKELADYLFEQLAKEDEDDMESQEVDYGEEDKEDKEEEDGSFY